MTLPWFKRDSAGYERFKEELKGHYPDLLVLELDALIVLQGGFPISHEGLELDRFEIRVTIPPEFPDRIPVVRELGGRVPPIANWHTLDQGALCILVPEEWLIHPSSGSIMAFLDGPLRNYLISHALAEKGVKRPMGERSHNETGLLEAYGDMVGSADHRWTIEALKYLTMDRVKGHWPCRCGSGKSLRKCHMPDILQAQKKVNPRVAKMALKRLYDQTKGRVGAIVQ